MANIAMVAGWQLLKSFRDVEGTLQDIDKWLRGVEWSRNYDDLMKVSTHEKRKVAEEKYKQREFLKAIQDGKKSKGVERV